MVFDKIKAIALGTAAASVAGGGSYLAEVDWTAVDPRWGIPVGGLILTGVGMLKKELTGYGAGVPKLSDQIPGGQPLPSGGE